MEVKLRSKNLWTDLTSPLPMKEVIKVATKHLDRAAYHLRDVSLKGRLAREKRRRSKHVADSDDESSEGLESESLSSSLDSEDGSSEDEKESKEKTKVKKSGSVKEEGTTKERTEEKALPKPDTSIQLNMEDLAECFKQLKLKLGKCGGGPSLMPRFQMMMYCIMCGNE